MAAARPEPAVRWLLQAWGWGRGHSWTLKEEPLEAFAELRVSEMKPESQHLVGQPGLSLQKSFIPIRGRKDDCDQGARRAFKGGHGLSSWVLSGWDLERWNSASALWLINSTASSPTLPQASALVPPPPCSPAGTPRATRICRCPHGSLQHQTGRKRGGGIWGPKSLISFSLFLERTF